MCGIAGIVRAVGHPVDAGQLRRMGAALAHRGPDADGIWLDDHIGLAHQRLAVQDTSVAGQQPMVSLDKRYVLCFNGEIYNFESLRQRLPSVPYRGSSDTEVLLHAIVTLGVRDAVSQLVGMFAFALLDRQAQQLWLVRDRLGVKPLYYGWCSGRLLFGSELSAIEAGAEGALTLSRDSLAVMMRHNHVPAPHSIYTNVFKLGPARLVCLKLSDLSQAAVHPSRTEQYWSLRNSLENAPARTDTQWTELVHAQLRQAVRQRLVADVPVGAFLSGGIDSALVVALMKEQSQAPVHTYTIGFGDSRFNEARLASNTAKHLGTRHNELYIEDADLRDAMDQLPRLSDEPFADQSILPTYLVSKMARESITVALSGDGGDELMFGYQRYALYEQMIRWRRRLPEHLRPRLANALDSRVIEYLARALPLPERFFGRRARRVHKLHLAAAMLGASDADDAYRYLMSLWQAPASIVKGATEHSTVYSDPPGWLPNDLLRKRVGLLDLMAYLPDDCLTKVDRASMSVGLEARVPLLDHRLVELLCQLPEHLVRDGSTSKVIFRRILRNYLPAELLSRPKAGFSVPLADWLRGPLKGWAADLLNENRFSQDDVFDGTQIMHLYHQHMSGRFDWSAQLWSVLVFQRWRQDRSLRVEPLLR